jgi:eukaryotic-like serine/threonine-protein kinase
MTVGRVLGGRYELKQLLGSGGMGDVWRGHDRRLDRPVAIKVLAGEGLSDPTAMERFEREARVVARLMHPNVVAVHDFGTEDRDPYLVMELVEGASVAAMLEHGPLPLDRAMAIGAQTCDGLSAAHAAGVIHRDVKPANLILTPSGVLKICDFGIARLQDAAGASRLTGPAVVVGSSSYMAPEQINNEPVDARTDLYGLGCTLYAMLAGTPPFAGDDPLAVAHWQVTLPPTPLQTRRPDVPPALAGLVHEMLAKAAADRPADAVEVRSRLAAVFTDAAAAAGTTSDLRLAAVPDATPPDASPVAGASEGGTAPPAEASPAGPSIPASPDGRPPQRRTNRFWRRAALGSAALLTVIAIPLLAAAGCLPIEAAGPPPAGARSPGSASPVPASGPSSPSIQRSPANRAGAATPRLTPPSASPLTASPTAVADPIVGMRLSIQRQLAAGSLAPAAATELYKSVDDIAAKINDGNVVEARKKIDELRNDLAKLVQDGRLTPAGQVVLLADLDRIEGSLAPAS